MGFYTATVTTDGSGDGTTTEWNGTFSGLLMGVRVEAAGAATGTDTTLDEPQGLQREILALTDTNTDASYNPQSQVQDTTGTDVSEYEPFLVDNTNLRVTVAQGGDTNTVTVYVLIREV